ncbi:MAG: serine hydrolase [Candidatus Aminicenantes bacterium]|jgi:CubicO group peptidase (beta-lactamase class C family)
MRKINRVYLTIIFLFVSISFTFPGTLQAGNVSFKGLMKKINLFLEKTYPANEPGASVLAVKDGKIILRRGYGMANLELGIPIKPEMVFRIGSITKQFTSVAIMKLAEEGKLSVTDDITKYLEDYPTHGHKITIHHLLNHTSGIKNYTNIKDLLPLMRKDMKPDELIDLFKNQPMDFAPGERFLYSNSGYVLLGAIIEKVSGKSYETYIDENIFKPLGMSNSYYGSNKRIIPLRASGYKKEKKEIRNADYLSMTLPHAAGALLSTVDDLHRWYRALEAGKVLSQKSLEQMYTPAKLNNGKAHNYGYGWGLGTLFGEKTIEHGGGINGFTTYALRVPEKKVFVTVLTNCPWRQATASYVSKWIAAVLCGKQLKEKKAVTLDTKILDAIVGVYKISEDEVRTVTREGNQLYTQRTRSPKLAVFAESETEFFYKNSFSHFTIVKDKSGKVIKMIMHGDGGDEEAIKISDKPAADKKEK